MAEKGEAKLSENLGPAESALRRCYGILIGVGLFTGVINVLALSGSFYMLQIYDRVLPSRSVPTLIGLTLLLVGLYLVYGLLDVIRIRVLSRVGVKLDNDLRGNVFSAVHLIPLRLRPGGDGLQPIRDLDQVRTFLSGLGPAAFFDMFWVPIYIAAVYLLHPVLGLFAFAGALVLVGLALLTEIKSTQPMRDAAATGSARLLFGESARRNAEVIRAMGLGKNIQSRWNELNHKHLDSQLRASDTVSGIGATSKIIRLVLQSGVLGLGAYLVIQGEVTAGTIIAASIITARALAPIETSIAHWRGFVMARQAYQRLVELFKALESESDDVLNLPPPEHALSVQKLSVTAPGGMNPIIQEITFDLKSGDGLGVIGPSASGKSTLARALVGVWRPMEQEGGAVRLDGAGLDQWTPESIGRHIGYLPQGIELFAGTIAENIARFDPDATDEDIIAAATAADVHEMIVRLPDGYQTQIGEGGCILSAGQRQRVGLARALYGAPFLVVLDEPNSNLDTKGDASLTKAIKSVRERGGIAVVIAHRPSALAAVDQLMVMSAGRVAVLGPKDDVMRSLMRPAGTTPDQVQSNAPPARQLKVVNQQDSASST